jgi:hypothetical protein
MWIKGVRFINEGIVTSVNDMVTEVVMQFVAEDVKPFVYNNNTNQFKNSDKPLEFYYFDETFNFEDDEGVKKDFFDDGFVFEDDKGVKSNEGEKTLQQANILSRK